MKKKRGGGIVAIVLIAIVVVFSLVTNIRALTGDESDYKTVTLEGAGEFFDMKYSVNYILQQQFIITMVYLMMLTELSCSGHLRAFTRKISLAQDMLKETALLSKVKLSN